MQSPPPPPPPERITPPESQSQSENVIKPIAKQRTGPNWFLIGGLGFVAFAVLCAVAAVIFSLFFFQADVPEQVVVEPTLDAINFETGDTAVETDPDSSSESPAEDNQAGGEEPAAPPEGESEPAPTNPDEAPTVNNNGLYEMASPDYGIHAFLFWRPELADRDLQFIEEAGFTWVKQEFSWREIEGAEKGAFDWSKTDVMMEQIENHNMKVIARISNQPGWAGGGYPEIGPPENYQDFADYLTAVATRYKGRIHAYQIWNEPNLSREWGNQPPNPAEYTELLRVAYEAIKAVDPQAIVISAGLAPTTRNDDVAMPDRFFIQQMYEAGAAPYFDMLGVHAPGFKAPPEMDPAEIANDPNFANPGDFEAGIPEELRRIYGFRHIEDLHDIMVENGDDQKRVAILEFGWTVDDRPDSPYRWHAVTQEQQAEYMVNAYQYAKENWQPWIGVMTVIFWPNPDWTPEDEQWFWGIAISQNPEIWPRPAYYYLKDMPK